MVAKQVPSLAEKLTRTGYPDFVEVPDQDGIVMLRINDLLICSSAYALSLPDEQLKALIDETVGSL
jgi:hypothetical protein